MRKSRGFTLIELLVTIAVLVIIAMIAAPSFGGVLIKQKLNSNANSFVSILNQAKSQAVLLRTTIAVCPNKTNTDNDFTKDECANAVIPSYSAMTTAQKESVQADRVYQVEIDSKVALQSTSASAVLFTALGNVSASKTFNLCASGYMRTINVEKFGNISQSSGTCS
ncbi:GspH/FimT family pseudopilin [Acinetobacter sp.]|uniref:GspH/FimT family pseudopilin n=1 Tax=Acinetobacter sp. TaxID=472 RepID=UPI0035B050B9